MGTKTQTLAISSQKGHEINCSRIYRSAIIVHSMNGIGKYIGLKRLKQKVTIETTLKLLMPEQIDCHLPASNLDQLQKYIGNEGMYLASIRWVVTSQSGYKAQKS